MIVVVLVIALTTWAGVVYTQEKNTKDGVAVVTVDGEVYGRYPLKHEMVEKIQLPDGSYNVLEIKNGEADISEASCPDKICVRHREVSKKDQNIVCLPNKVIVTIENGAESDVDSVAN